VQAVLHGDETMVRHILKTHPDLTQIGTGIDFSGRQFTGTAFQAAIAATDFAPNKNSTGLGELIVEQLKHQHPYQRRQILHDQPLELYVKSLRYYAEKQADKIRVLTEKQAAGEVIDETALEAEKQRHQAYGDAIHSKDLATIINIHTDAQVDHAFQVNPALIDAIANATIAQIHAIFDNHTIESPLSNLLKQFRADFTKLSHEEIIFNPQHLVKIFAGSAEFTPPIATNEYWTQCELYSSHLVGFMQRYLPINTAKIFANPGLDKTGFPSSFFPLDFNSNTGLGYEYVVERTGIKRTTVFLFAGLSASKLYKNIYQAKIKSFQDLLHDQGARKRPREFPIA
jgi:hypothetical protein